MAMRFLREETERQTKLEGSVLQIPTTTSNLISLLLPSANYCQKIKPRRETLTMPKVLRQTNCANAKENGLQAKP
jgi:hypothetical protein